MAPAASGGAGNALQVPPVSEAASEKVRGLTSARHEAAKKSASGNYHRGIVMTNRTARHRRRECLARPQPRFLASAGVWEASNPPCERRRLSTARCCDRLILRNRDRQIALESAVMPLVNNAGSPQSLEKPDLVVSQQV